MTVADLIERLKDLPSDSIVTLAPEVAGNAYVEVDFVEDGCTLTRGVNGRLWVPTSLDVNSDVHACVVIGRWG
mgnify:CR=1 FL=1